MSGPGNNSEKRKAQLRHRVKMHRWPRLVDLAYKGDAKQLCEYLRSPEMPLELFQREQLADLIDRRIHTKTGRGRKPGNRPSLPELQGQLTTSEAVRVVAKRLEKIRSKNNGRLPKGTLDRELETLARRYGENGLNVDVDRDQALADLRRGKPRRR